jgi:hypothetical protein
MLALPLIRGLGCTRRRRGGFEPGGGGVCGGRGGEGKSPVSPFSFSGGGSGSGSHDADAALLLASTTGLRTAAAAGRRVGEEGHAGAPADSWTRLHPS